MKNCFPVFILKMFQCTQSWKNITINGREPFTWICQLLTFCLTFSLYINRYIRTIFFWTLYMSVADIMILIPKYFSPHLLRIRTAILNLHPSEKNKNQWYIWAIFKLSQTKIDYFVKLKPVVWWNVLNSGLVCLFPISFKL